MKHGLVANVEEWPYSSFHRDNRDNPQAGDLSRFENMRSEYGQASGYGEREPEARRADQAKP